MLRQIDAPAASRALASLAVLGTSATARRLASESLAGRDPREFAGLLIGLLRDPIVFEVRQVKGPGEPGELYVHGERMNRRFFYAAPPPLATLGPNEIVSFDGNGLPVANRVVGYRIAPAGAAIDPLLSGSPDVTGASGLAQAGLGQAGQAIGQAMVQNQKQATAIGSQFGAARRHATDCPDSGRPAYDPGPTAGRAVAIAARRGRRSAQTIQCGRGSA